MNNHFKDKTRMLIVDDAREYPRYFPKNSNNSVVILEPPRSPVSKVFIKMTRDKVNNNKNLNKRFIMIEADISTENNKFLDTLDKNLIQKSFNCIMFKYNICTMINNIHNVIENLKLISSIQSKIIIVYIDGDLVRNLMRSSDRFEIIENDSVIFGLYRYDDIYYDNKANKQIVVFLRDTLRYKYGVIERLTTTKEILDAFNTEYILIEDDKIINYDNENTNSYKSSLSNIQKQISEVFRYMILQKKL